MEEELVIEPIIGYRSWLLHLEIDCYDTNPYDRPKLSFFLHGNGRGKDFRWEKGRNIAKCFDNDHIHPPLEEVPYFNCQCGFYAYKGKFPLISEAEQAHMVFKLLRHEPQVRRWFSGYYSVLGEVSLTGKVIEHDFGYRAQFAEIKRLVSIFDDSEESLSMEYLHHEYIGPASRWYSPAGSQAPYLTSPPIEARVGRVNVYYVKQKLYDYYQIPITEYQDFVNEVK